MTGVDRFTAWPDTSAQSPPADHLYRSGTWLLGRHPRLAQLAARIQGVVEIENGELNVDLDHLSEVVAAVPRWVAAWDDYENRHRPPTDESDWERWHAAGPKADDFARGLRDFLVMSSGETAMLRLLAAFGSEPTPVRVSDLRSLDAEGGRLLADWCRAVQAAYGVDPGLHARFERPVIDSSVGEIAFWPADPPGMPR